MEYWNNGILDLEWGVNRTRIYSDKITAPGISV